MTLLSSFDYPLDGSADLVGTILVSGWAISTQGVTKVELYRLPVLAEVGEVLIGTCVFAPGTPDLARIYPEIATNGKADWVLPVLTNFFPNVPNSQPAGGVGTFTLKAYATETDLTVTLIGSHTIKCDNSKLKQPFGTIDVPAIGDSESGVVDSQGWALTPLTATIPISGSTIRMFIDGYPYGTALTYNNDRLDVAALFPGLHNTNGAGGQFSLDTTALRNGQHVLAWMVIDNQGRANSLGNFYFTVSN